MLNDQICLEKYFDDGVVQYWRPIAANQNCMRYRLTVEPSWISVDTLGWSWNGRRCWRRLYPNIKTMEEATSIVRKLLSIPSTCRQDMLVRESSGTLYMTEFRDACIVSESIIQYAALASVTTFGAKVC